MIVKVIIKRKIQQGKTREVFSLLNKFRSQAMNRKGYISGETLFNYDDPNEVMVISIWHGVENWLKWKDDEERKANERLLERWLDGATEYQTYVLGTYYTQFSK